MNDDVVAQLRRDVAAQTPVDERHRASIAEFLAALDCLPQPLSRDADRTHVTASAIVTGPRGVVLHRHKRMGVWLQPGGHIDPGERPEHAALREVKEETGLDARHPPQGPRLVHVDVHPAGEHVHLDLRYLVAADDVDPAPPPEESPHVRWFAWPDAIAAADEALVGALRSLAPQRNTDFH